MAARLYFDADDGVTYRVHDVTFVDGKTKLADLGDAAASARMFVPESGARRIYKFRSLDSHFITGDELARQLRQARYLPGRKGDPTIFTAGKRPE